jgi:hypothetical protein
MPTHLQTSTLPDPPTTVFDWHDRPGAFERLTPPWEDIRMVARQGGLEAGATLELSMPLLGPLRTRWLGHHTWCERPDGFIDVADQGPFASWTHTHRFEPDETGTRMTDRIDWVAPLGPLGWAGHPMIRQRLARTFAWRHERIARDLARHREVDAPPLRIAMTGSTGLVGTALSAFLTTGGHTVVPLTRDRQGDGIFWDPLGGEVGPGLADVDAVVHLAGAPIAGGRWTEAYKASIRDSRVVGTQTLVRALADLPPKVFVSTSAVGFHGDRGDAILTEESPPGQGFLADVCQAWEAATDPLRAAGWRVAVVRTGLVISGAGGLLEPLLPLFRLGLGGRLGDGQQWMSCIHIDDLVALYHHLLTRELEGVFHGTGPTPVTNADFTRILARALRRPALAPAPAFALRLALGREKADELLLAGQRAVPARALDSGFRFDAPTLADALAFELP